jgi:AcrR family transcriptional regulator
MTVKQKKRGRPSAEMNQLTSQVIIDTAKSLMRDSGSIPSIRALASSLNVDAMAIYHYFKNKNALLEAITVSLIEDIYAPTSSHDWQAELATLCLSYLTLLSNYSGLLETLLTMSSTGPAKLFSQRFEQILSPLALKPAIQKSALDLLVDYLHGFALAMSCNNSAHELSHEMIQGPLSLLCSGLASAANT